MPAGAEPTTFYDITATMSDGQPVRMDRFRGQVLLIVNVASQCGFTPQYAGLEALYRRYRERGFSVLAFPCNQFGRQEPGSNAEIQQFCQENYAVTFPLFEKVEVNGAGAHPLFKFLKARRPGFLGLKAIRWNFTKFVVNRQGMVAARFAPTATPASIEGRITSLLEDTP
ncbi:MAG TPA: glutathione peroxidase [Vicinamibacterales bacterium]|nr:glutathione peroxidase [Vicinamibacterales bacterium]